MAPEPQFEVQVPHELEGGVYSNFMSVWSSPFEFTLDFCATLPAQQVDPDDPASPIRVPCRVVSRVKIPPTVLFDVLRALNEQLTTYEKAFGEVKPPQNRTSEGD